MTPLVLGLNGSPRRDGNSDTLLREALRGAQEQGARVTVFDLAFLNISPCKACEECFSNGDCVIRDDMDRVYAALEEADHVIVASPIYFSGMSSYAKLAVDRSQALWARRKVLDRARRPGTGSIVLCAAQPDARFDNAVSELRAFLLGIGIAPGAVLKVPGAEGRSFAAGRPDILERARELGRDAVSTNPGP
ncbi:MAG: flavodoxin family protein [Euryarchaeota archaeon]|nr:flavodoxin family protein [Euryarchaeota archaeon]